MDKKETKELKNKSIKELSKLLEEKRKEVLKLSVKLSIGEQKNLKERVAIRRDIARILSTIRELGNKE